jgi:hypothetical protein
MRNKGHGYKNKYRVPLSSKDKATRASMMKVPPTYFGKISAETSDDMHSLKCCITNIKEVPQVPTIH